ncbi:MAG: hypothetical protein WCI87_07640 [Euryarchaeota archaeon]
MFKQLSFERWLKQQKVPLTHGSNHSFQETYENSVSKWETYFSGIIKQERILTLAFLE